MPANERESEAEAAYRAANPTPAAASEHHPDDCPECKFTEQLAEYEATASESERRLRTMANREVLELRSALTAAQQERDDLAELVIGYRNQIRNECLRAEVAEQEAATLRAERDAMRARVAEATAKLKQIVCVEPPDDGVVLLSYDGPCHPDPVTGVSTYDHVHFSPLGDALIELWRHLNGGDK